MTLRHPLFTSNKGHKMNKIIIISIIALSLVGCGEKSKAAAEKLGDTTKEFISTAASEAADSATAAAKDAANKAVTTAKAKAAEAAEAAAEALKK